MSSPSKVLQKLNSPVLRKNSQSALRGLATQTQSSAPSNLTGNNVNTNVPGLSTKCLKVPNEPVGPGAKKDGEYKNPEYFCYNETSYFEAEIEMAKYRIPQPSNKK